MPDPAIIVENLSKRYRINSGGGPAYHRLSEAAAGIPQAIWHAARNVFPASSRLNDSVSDSLSPDTCHLTPAQDFWALKDVSFEVQPGEVVGIIGRNGAGKSTLLKILSRITEPTSGRFGVRGRVASLLEVGTGFHPELTGRENIYVSGVTLGMTRAEIKKRFDEIVDFSGVEKFLDTPVKHYSSGMQVRLGFAVAAHLESEVLIIDEVLAVGDADFQKKCLGKISMIAEHGRTVLFVSHNMDAIRRLCRSVIHVQGGQCSQPTVDLEGEISRYFGIRTDSSSKTLVPPIELTSLRNPWFSPTDFRLIDQESHLITQPTSNDSVIMVEISGTISRVAEDFTVGFLLSGSDGNQLFWSCITDQERSKWTQWHCGEWKLQTRIPSRLLNEGSYRIELAIKSPGNEWVSRPQQNAPTIHLEIQGGLSDSPRWFAKRTGLLAPVLSWTAQPMTAN